MLFGRVIGLVKRVMLPPFFVGEVVTVVILREVVHPLSPYMLVSTGLLLVPVQCDGSSFFLLVLIFCSAVTSAALSCERR